MYSISYEHFLFFLLQTGAVKLKKSPDTPSSNCDTSSEGSNSKNDIPPMKPVGKLITLQCCQLGVNFLRKKRKNFFELLNAVGSNHLKFIKEDFVMEVVEGRIFLVVSSF